VAAAAAAPAAISHAPLASRQTQLYRGSRTVTTGMVPGLPAPRVALSDQSTQTGTPAEPGPAPQSDGQRLAATTASVPSQTDASLLRGLFHGMPPAVGVDAYRHRLAVAQAAAADLATAEAVAAAIAAAQAEDEPNRPRRRDLDRLDADVVDRVRDGGLALERLPRAGIGRKGDGPWRGDRLLGCACPSGGARWRRAAGAAGLVPLWRGAGGSARGGGRRAGGGARGGGRARGSARGGKHRSGKKVVASVTPT